jgi:serine/threonine protein kinase
MSAPPLTAIGPFRLTRQLGVGASATVYAATDGREEVALKVRWRQPDHPQEGFMSARFREGARLQGWMCHPNIVWLHAAFEARDYQAVALEVLTGGTLTQALKARGPLPRAEVCALGFALADALDHMHDLGVIHRDLKPDNVLLDHTGALTRARVSDFDVSRHPLLTPHITEPGAHVGTLWYTSPEQFDQADPSAPDDVYSLGVLLYEAAAGALPFEPLTQASIFRRFLDHAPLPPLSRRAPQAGAGLEWVLERAADSRLSGRVPSAATLGVLLMALEPSLARSVRARVLMSRVSRGWLASALGVASAEVQRELVPCLQGLGVLD